MLRHLLLYSLMLGSAATVVAQEAATDTLAESRVLQEVVVAAPRVIHKFDSDVYYPSKSAKELSKDGMQLIRSMGIPTLTVNEVFGNVTSLGNAVQIRVNGRVVSANELKTIMPENIKRIEWIQNPGLKYGGASAVLNIILTNPTLGGSLMASDMVGLNMPWNEANATLKLNNGRSQWGVSIFEKMDRAKSYREYQERFTYPDGKSLTRTEIPIKGKMQEHMLTPTVSYSYIKPDTTVVYASVSLYKAWPMGDDYTGLMKLSDNSKDIILHDKSFSDGLTPSFTAYLEQHIGKKHVIAVDASASIYKGSSYRTYTEQIAGEDLFLSDVNTDIKDSNKSYGVKMDYTRSWDKSRFTAGANYHGASNKSTYMNLDGLVSHQSQNSLSMYAEYSQGIGKVKLTGGLGATYSSYRLRESGKGTDTWGFRPTLSVNYRPTRVSTFYMGFYTYQNRPSLSEANPVATQIDGFQWQVGNPALKAYTTYRIDAQYQYAIKRLSGTLGVNLQTSPDAIAPFYRWEEDRLVSSYENSRGHQWLSAYISPQIDVVPGWFMVNGLVRWGVTRTRGTGYNLTRHNWSGEVTGIAYHWGFNFIVQYRHSAGTLFGESEVWGEKSSMIALQYNWKNWQFMGAILSPFTKYDRKSCLYNQYYSNEKHKRISMSSMPLLKVAYNLQWGRQKQGVNKRVNADSSVEQSTAGSR